MQTFHKRLFLHLSDPETGFRGRIRVRLWDSSLRSVRTGCRELRGLAASAADICLPDCAAVCRNDAGPEWMKRLAIEWGIAAAATMLGYWLRIKWICPPDRHCCSVWAAAGQSLAFSALPAG